jgi:hypothetical protein
MPTREQYHAAFVTEREQVYPVVTAYEEACGYAADPVAILAAARILACPVKANPPNWQHGRVLYAVARKYLNRATQPQHWIDIGTAKGFSACVMSWALEAAGAKGIIRSFDVIDPLARVARNSIADTDTLRTVPELTEEHRSPSVEIEWHGEPFHSWADRLPFLGRVHLAFVDGRHSCAAIWADLGLIIDSQEPGDIIIFDDLQIPEVCKAVKELKGYDIPVLWAKPSRGYAIAVKA